MLDSKSVANTNMSECEASKTIRFGLFELDVRAGELRRNGVRVKLQEQPYQILIHLLETPGVVVTREELRERLWPANTFVDFDHGLNAAIRRLRDALGDSAENPRFVETVARRGYRFLAPVTAVPVNADRHTPQVIPATSLEGLRKVPRLLHLVAAFAGIALIFLGIRLGLILAHGHPISPVRVAQLTANPAEDRVRAAAISADGKYLAFSDETGFYIRQIETGETHPIPMPEQMKARSVAWFPDSAHLVLGLGSSMWQTSLWEVSALGGNSRKLNDDGRLPSVSPDGKTLAFVIGGHFRQQVWVQSLDGDQPRKIAGNNADVYGALAWSPDSSMLAYTHGTDAYGYGADGEIQIVDVRNQSNPVLRARQKTMGLDGPLVWTADGQLIYAVAEPPPRTPDSNLWSSNVDAQGTHIGPSTRLTTDIGEVFTMSVSSSGKRIAYLKGIPEPDVYVAKLDRSGQISEPQRLTLDDRRDIPYDWTTDGKEIIFTSDRGGELNIYRQGIDQTVAELVVRSAHPLVESRLSSDGTQLLYVEYPRWGEPAISSPLMRVPLAGGTPTKILEDNWISNHQCARAPATECIYSVVNGRTLKFFTFDPIRGKGKQLFQIEDDLPRAYNWSSPPDRTTRGKGRPFFQIDDDLPKAYNWSLSPDGTTLAVTKGKAESETRIRLVPLNDGDERWLTIPISTSSLDWAADSRSLWAATSPDEENELLNIDLRGHVHTVWRPKKKAVGWAIPSRDGRSLALYVGSVSANVWMMDR